MSVEFPNVGKDNFTSLSVKGKAVVDYMFKHLSLITFRAGGCSADDYIVSDNVQLRQYPLVN